MLRSQNLSNLKTEKEGIQILKELVPQFFVPSKMEKIALYTLCEIPYSQFSKSIDGVILQCSSFNEIESASDFLFVEIKTTKRKSVTDLPYGAFFGITENEEKLFQKAENYRLCIVHTGLKKHCLLNFSEYQGLIHNKRIQYQVNFISKIESLSESKNT
jgi:hypothetical protein